MPFDAVSLLATVREIDARVVGGRIDKIYQPERDEVVLSVRLARGGAKLLLSVGAGTPRILLTRAEKIRRRRRGSVCCCASICRALRLCR